MTDSYEPVVQEFIKLLAADDGKLGKAFDVAIQKAQLPDIQNLKHLYSYINANVQRIPQDSRTLLTFVSLYYIAAFDDEITSSVAYQDWVVQMARAWGDFLDSPVSIQHLDQFVGSLEDFDIHQYDRGPSGWRSFNQFFARKVRPGMRPIAALNDASVIVSPVDGQYWGKYAINENVGITIKGLEYNIADLMKDSPYVDEFKDGTFTHTALRINDYHHFHTPVAGDVLEARHIKGLANIEFEKDQEGKIAPALGLNAGFLFNHMRGMVVLRSPEVGFVALICVGIAQISSVTVTAEAGKHLHKGEGFGYFQFGGSDVITLFQKGKVELDGSLKPQETILEQGQQVGRLVTLE